MLARSCIQCSAPLVGRQREFCSRNCVANFQHDRTAERFWARVEKGAEDECWEWQGHRSPKGYGETSYKGKRGMRCHRLAVILGGRHLERDQIVMHSCDNPPCCNPAHLKIGTHLDNNRDMIAKGRDRRLFGPDNHNTKLGDDQKRAIIARRGEPLTVLAAEFGVNKSTICRVQRRALCVSM